MAATKVQANWATVSHGNTSITKVTSVSFNQGGKLTKFSGDGDVFPTLITNLMNDPSATVTTADAGTLMGIAPGTVATFNATHKDALGASGGAIVYALANAVVENVQASGNHGAYGTATMTLQAYSSDGSTNPLSFTRS